MDFSGSEVLIESSVFMHMGDKALSIGEKSNVTIFNVVIQDSEIGIASKDNSSANIYSSVIFNNNTGLAGSD